MFKDRVALITGSSRGIGANIAITLANLGAKVVINSRSNNSDIDGVEEYLKSINSDFYKAIGDVSDINFVEKTINKIIKQYNKIDILINNAGIIKDNIILNMSYDDFDSVINTNLKGSFNFIKNVLPYMIQSKYGKIVNISSHAGIVGNFGQANYSASKSALNTLTKVIAKETGRYNININAVAPGFVETDIVSSMNKDYLLSMKKKSVMKRFARTDEITQLVLFLISDLCGYLNGEVITVDGGGYL